MIIKDKCNETGGAGLLVRALSPDGDPAGFTDCAAAVDIQKHWTIGLCCGVSELAHAGTRGRRILTGSRTEVRGIQGPLPVAAESLRRSSYFSQSLRLPSATVWGVLKGNRKGCETSTIWVESLVVARSKA